MNTLYRIEDVHGIGMFYSEVANLDDCPHYQTFAHLHPLPYKDLKLMLAVPQPRIFSEYLFGVSQPSLLENWVLNKKTLDWLVEGGFRLGIYFPEVLYEGESQSVMPKDGEFIRPPAFMNLSIAAQHFGWYKDENE